MLKNSILGVPSFLLFAFVITSIVFVLFPVIDIFTSSIFYKADIGFYLSDNPFVMFLYRGIPIFTTVVVVTVIGCLIGSWSGKKHIFSLSKKAYIYLLLVMFIGPGLLNTISKDNWGRARPVMIEQFGGDREFTPAFVMTDQCDKNCSFFSGHPTSVFFFIAVALVSPLRFRRKIMGFAIVGGGLVGLGRVIQGGHFLSDIVTSGFFVAITSYIIYWLMFVSSKDLGESGAD